MNDVSVFLKVAYDGTSFHGFARQPGLLTIQGSLEGSLAVVMGRPVPTTGAGRTDAGVHAQGQVVSFLACRSEVPDLVGLVRALDGLTPDSICVIEARLAGPLEDARFSAVGRAYRYRISAGGPAPVLSRPFVWRRSRALDLAAMRAGAAILAGEHDFRAFCVTPSARGARTVRTIDRIDVLQEDVAREPVVAIVVEGRSFLHSMVRIIAGTLADVGRSRRSPADVATALEACDRAAAGETAPAHGLVLEAVLYDPDMWLQLGG